MLLVTCLRVTIRTVVLCADQAVVCQLHGRIGARQTVKLVVVGQVPRQITFHEVTRSLDDFAA